MNELLDTNSIYIDQNNTVIFESDLESDARQVAGIVLDLSQVTIDMSCINRKPRYFDHREENNAEHSFMLGLVSMEVGNRFFPGLDVGLMTQFSLVHDLVELETGDVATFDVSQKILEEKQEAEHRALKRLQNTLPRYTADMLTWYEEQEQPEARLVRHLDKQLPYAVNINGAGITLMKEGYNVHSVKALDAKNTELEARFDHMFPETSHKVIRKTHGILAKQFARQFAAAT